jgi:hypothetical protein
MRRLLLLVLALAGCRQLFRLDTPTLGSGARTDASGDVAIEDAPADAIPDANACAGASAECLGDVLRTCSGAGMQPVDATCVWGCGGTPTPHCLELVPAGGAVTSLDLASTAGLADITLNMPLILIDTDTGRIGTQANPTLIRGGGNGIVNGIDFVVRNNIAVFRFQSLTITNTVAPIASHAVALVSLGDISVSSTVFVQSGCANGGGLVGGYAGGNQNADGSGPGGGPGPGGASGTGGAGGSYGGTGGRGGNGGIPAPTYGMANSPSLVGGSGGGGGGGAAGGAGGGAIQLVSNTQITISGGINAGGCGGHSSMSNANGGGGGGAGGTILLEAPTISISGALAVNGGGGGAVGGSGTGSAGTLDRVAAVGDAGGIANGGAGAAGAMPDGINGATSGPRGGGGGGAIGRIRINTKSGTAALAAAVLSPAPNDPSSTCTVAPASTQ